MVHAAGAAMAHEIAARRIATLLGVTTLVVGACDGRDHPPFAPSACGPLDAAVGDAGPDAGTAVVNCGNPSNVPGGGTVPPGAPSGNNGGQPVISIGGAPSMGAGGSPGIGGTGAFGGNGLGAGGFFNGIGGNGAGGTGTGGAGTGAFATSPGGAGTGIGAAGVPIGSPGIGGVTF